MFQPGTSGLGASKDFLGTHFRHWNYHVELKEWNTKWFLSGSSKFRITEQAD